MIKSNELRIGNWILGTPTYNKDLLKSYQVYAETFCDIESGHGLFKPIPLTEDILLKCGFKKEVSLMSSNYTLFGNIKNEFNTPFEIDIFIKSDGTFETGDDLPMLYLHQLQNYVYCRTGEELNIIL